MRVKSCNVKQLNHEEIVVKLLQLVLDNNQKKVNDENTGNAAGPTEADRHIADILEKLRNESNVDTLQKILDGLKKDSAEGGETGVADHHEPVQPGGEEGEELERITSDFGVQKQ
ncbi:hypothetical protein NQ317_008647 [Molorchus minor]|uniref:Uncharacterized protein n=1 Tax=Molorchus minor TaxID=1323400 RepID=A0ABQ9K369_9CUCU|nr:hypothetical protein NQ317_008647 [Molorchus minor]